MLCLFRAKVKKTQKYKQRQNSRRKAEKEKKTVKIERVKKSQAVLKTGKDGDFHGKSKKSNETLKKSGKTELDKQIR